jgi:AraC-like DNA-binding protein
MLAKSEIDTDELGAEGFLRDWTHFVDRLQCLVLQSEPCGVGSELVASWLTLCSSAYLRHHLGSQDARFSVRAGAPVSRNGLVEDNRLKRLRLVLRTSPYANISIGDAAREVGLSASHLQHLLKKMTGRTYSDVQRTVRLEQATNMLDEGQLLVKEVAGRLGYSSARRFSRDFKRLHGISPKDWRLARRLGSSE